MITVVEKKAIILLYKNNYIKQYIYTYSDRQTANKNRRKYSIYLLKKTKPYNIL